MKDVANSQLVSPRINRVTMSVATYCNCYGVVTSDEGEEVVNHKPLYRIMS